MRTSQKGPAADEVSLEAAYRELQATFHSQHAELESQLADAAAELAEVRLLFRSLVLPCILIAEYALAPALSSI